jgi:DNA-binding response OmpR family regulator
MRFDWVDTADVQRMHDIETCLLGERFARPDINLVEKDLRKPVQAIQSLRQSINAAVGRDETLYYRGLLYHAASRLLAYDPAALLTNRELASLAHVLIAVAMLGKKIAGQAGTASPTRSELQLDKSRHTVTVAGRAVELQGDGYKILYYLYDHHDTVCSRADILLAVYEVAKPSADDDRRLNTALRRLRNKIEPDSNAPIFLITHPGQGYELKIQA